MTTTAPLTMESDFSLGSEAFDAIVDDMRALGPRNIVEFGAGASSIRLATALPDTRIFSIEHNRRFYDLLLATIDALESPLPNLTVVLRELRRQQFGCYHYRSYDPRALPSAVDAVLVDGPPGWLLRGREACLHQVAGSLRVGSRIYLDDTRRPGEARISDNWLRQYPSLRRIRQLPIGHGIHVFETEQRLGPPRVAMGPVIDNLGAASRALGRGMANRLRRLTDTGH